MARDILKILNIFVLASILAFPALASEAKKQKLKKAAIQDAISQSEQDGAQLKKKVDSDKEKRMNSWSERDTQAISIKNTGAYFTSDSFENNTHDPELDELRKDIKAESTDVDFDSELSEVEVEPELDKKEPAKAAKKPASTPPLKK